MMEIPDIDLAKLFYIKNSIPELILRGSILYLGLLFLLRILPRRTGGELATMDLIFVILIAEAATHSFGDYTSISEGFLVIVTLILWNFLINWLSFHVPFIEKMVSAPPLQIIKAGKLLRRNMRREFITEEELRDHLHKEGVEDLAKVKAAYVESDGKITVIQNTKEA